MKEDNMKKITPQKEIKKQRMNDNLIIVLLSIILVIVAILVYINIF